MAALFRARNGMDLLKFCGPSSNQRFSGSGQAGQVGIQITPLGASTRGVVAADLAHQARHGKAKQAKMQQQMQSNGIARSLISGGNSGAAGGDRTHDPWLRRPKLVLASMGISEIFHLYWHNFGTLLPHFNAANKHYAHHP